MKIRMMLACAVVLAGIHETGTSVQAQNRKFQETVTVQGDVRDRWGDHELTFSAPVALPGLALGPGTYVFREMSGHVVQVTNAAGDPYSMFLTVPATRRGPADDYSIILGEPAAPGAPRRIVALFIPGEDTGHEFVYATR